MDYVVKISTPVLVTGQYFKVRYREYPAGSFGSYVNYTTNEFTLTGLTPQDYEIEVIFYNGTEECPAILAQFTVKEIPDCWEFTPEFQTNGVIYWIRVLWLGTLIPACGYKFYWTQGAASGVVNYSSGGVPLDIIVPNSGTVHLKIVADDCDSTRICYEDDLVYSAPCIDLTITGTSIEPTIPNGYWMIIIDYAQGTPITTSTTCSYTQTGALAAGATRDSGSITITGGIGTPAGRLIFKTIPGATLGGGVATYSGTFTDSCGHAIAWSV